MEKIFLDEYVPEVWKLYLKQAEEAVKDGELSNKTKEIIAAAVAIASHCEPCVKLHIRRAVKAGANAKEISEMVGVVVMLCGGTAEIWARRIVEREIKSLREEES
ncbi:MAG: carboxymuconolactone decarboxylase family protein [Candidatus Aminicenantaceae bacterium]